MKEILFVGLGGGAGSVLRYLITVFTARMSCSHFPSGTLAVNMLGCYFVGVLVGLIEGRQVLDSPYRLLLVTGFCGGFTTFSAFTAESLRMFENGNWLQGFLYIAGSILIGLLFVWLGILTVK